MNIHTHFLFPFFIALLFSKLGFFSWKFALLAGIVGMLVDIDHYIEHIIHTKKNRFSLRDTWNNSIKLHRFNQRSFIHEGIGVFILTILFLIVAYFNVYFSLALFMGYYSHILLDGIYLRHSQHFRGKVSSFFLKESYAEIVLNVILLALIVLLFLF